jgi:ABC-type glycerol-3-phosphate transport system substrate-binding protein
MIWFSTLRRTAVQLNGCIYAIAAAACLSLSFGCSTDKPPISTNEPGNAAAAMPHEVRLAVVDNARLANAIENLRGEWKTQTDTELKVNQLTSDDLNTSKQLDVDAVIYPTELLGTLAEQRLIRPLNRDWLKDDPLDAADLLMPLDSLDLTWDGQPYAVPLGSPVMMLLYRPDLFEKFGKQPPRTWEEYQQLVDFFSNRKLLGTSEPLVPNWAGRLLLARAAAYAKHRDYQAVLFDRETMAPLIAGPPFVRALTELVAAAKDGPQDAASLTPADAAWLALIGRTAMAIGWPAAVAQKSTATVPIAFAHLPGSETAYNPRHAAWEPRRSDEATSIPLRGLGIVGSVVRGADDAQVAFRLLAWLSSKRGSNEVLATDAADTLFRQSQVDDPNDWFGNAISPEAKQQFGQVLEMQLRQREAVWMPRIPGEAEYMAALDEAVLTAIGGNQLPQLALDDTAAKWKKITTRLGVDSQLEAYHRSLKAEH